MDWRRLETDETFLELYDRERGAVGREIASLERQIFDLTITDPVQLGLLKGRRSGLLLVADFVSQLARQEEAEREQRILESAAPRPSESPFPRIF